ncbi:hypothetical protein L1049_026056 [Liquidambar formosana]|uniref:Leucine-rich repeat-containing N-terminal plant-type domain-containing protein n=1 Tax=Liquidambar formosana TaxID=63359 RepID=A0AAP0NE04_LIQFO
MEVHRALRVVVSFIFLIIRSALAQQLPLSSGIERSALLDLRSSLGITAKNWPIKSDPCSSWTGIECRNGSVIGINVSGFRGTRGGGLNRRFAVDALANLTLLASFNSSGFALPGSIPDWFGQRLSALQVLDLRSCSVIGPIPPSIGNLTGLNSLYLSGNSLTGIIPSALGQLSGLSVLDVSRNLLTGSVPDTFSSLGNLTQLDLSSNYLSGSIPPGLGDLSNLQFLNLSNNSLAAYIPNEVGNLSQLIELDLSSNSLSGSLPVDLGGLRNLQFVVLSGNKFDGALPEMLWAMPKLQFLDVSGNNFAGVLPNFSSNANVSEALFNLSNNLFYGDLVSLPGKFRLIDLSGNYLQGMVPNDTQNNANVTGNCLQTVQNQRSLEDCRLFYAERGLTFDNFGYPDSVQPPSPGTASESNKRLIFILAGVSGGLRAF